MITADSSSLHKTSDRTQTENLWFLSASFPQLSYTDLQSFKNKWNNIKTYLISLNLYFQIVEFLLDEGKLRLTIIKWGKCEVTNGS